MSLKPDTIATLTKVSTATITTVLLKKGLRNVWMRGARPLREGQKRLVESIALRRLGTPADIAHAALFFASDYAGWITGQVLSVSGGR